MEQLVIFVFCLVIFAIGLLIAGGFVIGKFGLVGLFWLCAIVGAIWLLFILIGFIFSLFG